MHHTYLTANGLSFHLARIGNGRPLLLLHGWPEFWLTWERVMSRLEGKFDLLAPDLRGFGSSEKPDAGPSDRAGADVHAADMLSILDTLGIERVGVVAHDVGAYVAQSLGRIAPGRLAGIFLFDCPYPGIGARSGAPEHLKEIWYQFFHQLPLAPELVGSSRDACRIYFRHFLRHWCHRKDAFDDVLEAWVDNFMLPGNLQGGFNWYISANAGRLAMLRGLTPVLPPIAVPTCVRWGEHDPVLRAEWGDRLGEFFSDLDCSTFRGVGHFPHMEDPERSAAEISAFFDRVWAD